MLDLTLELRMMEEESSRLSIIIIIPTVSDREHYNQHAPIL